MSSASSAVTYTSVYTDSEPGRPVAPPSPDYVPGPEHPPSPDYVPGPEHSPSPVEVPYVLEPEYPEYLVPSDVEVPLEDQPLPADASPTALSPGYPSDDDDDDDDTDDEDEEPFEDEDDNEEEEHLAPADSSTIPVVDLIRLRRERKTVRLEPPMSPSMEARIAEYVAAPAPPLPPLSPLSPWSPPLPQIPSPPLPPLPSLPLPVSLFIPPLFDRRKDIPEAELPPRKRLCLTAPTSRYEVGESLTAAPRPTGGHRADYRTGKTQLFQRVDGLVKDGQFHYETARLLDQEALVSREAWAHSVGLSSVVHYELQAYRTHTQMQDFLIALQALQARGQTHADDREGAGTSMAVRLVFSFLVSDNHNNILLRRSSATARTAARAAAAAVAATPMTAAVVE
ncbi:hypothetical protein Tco_0121949 [Tanacetum coccineum]